ncbi:NUDIX hydrolase [Corynebacterium callunae]|uniref:NUDIX domain-containing protein n=1 Tax=Corynebacterium callunae TaxID=1721 RepID=UPI0039827D11
MKGDGDGWAAGPNGAAMWGKNGAAGILLLAAPAGAELNSWSLLMQHRAHWTNNGGTWALPGGARDSHETVEDAALREAEEETGIKASDVEILKSFVTAGPFPKDPQRPELPGEWSYTTVIARTVDGQELPTTANNESLELRWVPLSEVDSMPLMPAFEKAWPKLRDLLGELAMTH